MHRTLVKRGIDEFSHECDTIVAVEDFPEVIRNLFERVATERYEKWSLDERWKRVTIACVRMYAISVSRRNISKFVDYSFALPIR